VLLLADDGQLAAELEVAELFGGAQPREAGADDDDPVHGKLGLDLDSRGGHHALAAGLANVEVDYHLHTGLLAPVSRGARLRVDPGANWTSPGTGESYPG